MAMVGLSLSFCVRDILNGAVAEDDVEFIITGTACRTEADWFDVLMQYAKIYWRDNPERGLAIARRLRAADKIAQPRLHGVDGPNLAHGHWRTVR